MNRNYVIVRKPNKKVVDIIPLSKKLGASTGRLTAGRKKMILAKLRKKKAYKSVKAINVGIVKASTDLKAIKKAFPKMSYYE